MLLKYNDGETTFILQTDQFTDVDDIDYFNDIFKGDKVAASYSKDGHTIHTYAVLAEEASTEEPHIKEL